MEYLNSFEEYMKEENEGAMVQDNSLKQLKKIQKLSAKTDIGNKLKNDNSKPALDTKIETYQDYMKNPDTPKKNKKK